MESWKIARQKVKELIEVVEDMRDEAERLNLEKWEEWEQTGDTDAREESAYFSGEYVALYTMVRKLNELHADMLHI